MIEKQLEVEKCSIGIKQKEKHQETRDGKVLEHQD